MTQEIFHLFPLSEAREREGQVLFFVLGKTDKGWHINFMFISFPCLEWLNWLAGRAFLSVVVWRVFAAMAHLCMRNHSPILSTWIGLLLLLPYKTLKLIILVRDPCAYKIGTSLPFLKIFCLEDQTPCCPCILMEHKSVPSLRMCFCWTQELIWMFTMYSYCRICEQQWKRKYLLKTKGQDMNVIPNLLFLYSSPGVQH